MTAKFRKEHGMKKINFVKISLDIFMTLVFVLLYNKMAVSGLSFHEIAGLLMGAVFIVHIALNWRWVKQVSLNILKKKISIKTKIGYVVDLLLLFSMGYIIFSGIMISKVLFPNLNVGNRMFFQSTHISVAYGVLLLIGIHLGLHWNWVMNTFKKMFRLSGTNLLLGYAAKALVIGVLVSGIYSMSSVNYFKRLPVVGTVASAGHGAGMERGQFDKGNDNPTFIHDGNEGKMNFSDSGNFGPGGSKGNGSANIVSILITYLSIIGGFTIATFYIEKFLLRLVRLKKVYTPIPN